MRKILLVSVFAAFIIGGCKKKADNVSTPVTVNYPKITISGSQYVSIPVNGSFTPPSATAVDTFYNEKPTVVKNLGTLDVTTPGLYTVTYSAKNSYGFVGTANVYVAVTDVSDTLDISLTGTYLRLANPNRVAHITKLAKGLFMTDNVGGVDITNSATGPKVSAVFAVLDLTTFTFGTQITSDGVLSSNSESLALAAGTSPTTINYAIQEASFGTQVRTFVKQ